MKKISLKRKSNPVLKEHKRLLKEDARRFPDENYKMAIDGYILDFYNHVSI